MNEKSSDTSSRLNRPTNRVDIGLSVVSLVALAVLIPVLLPIVPESFQLQFNAYALISLAGLLLDLSLLVILFRRHSHSDSTLWFALFIVIGILWSGSEAFERMATTPLGAAFWGDIISGVVCFMPVFFYLFVRSYTNRSRVHIPLWVPVSLIGSGLAMMALLSANNVFALPAISERTLWGYSGPMSPVSIVYIVWAAVLTIGGIVRLIGFFRGSKSVQDRRQSLIFIISSAAVLVVSALTEVLLPMLGVNFIPPLGVLTNSLLALSVIVGIYRYGSFSVGINEIAETVLSTMAGGVLVTDTKYQVEFCNARAAELLSELGQQPIGLNLLAVSGKSLEPARAKWEADLKLHGASSINDLQIGRAGETLTVNLNVTALQTEQSGYIFVFNDISELKKASDDIIAQSAKLELSNKAFQQSQVAMLNLLEDSRVLETELRLEKAGIEKKVTDRTKELQAERESLEAIINGVDFGIYMLNSDLHVTLANKSMQEFYALAMNKPYSLEALDADIHNLADTQADLQEAIKTRQPVRRAEFARGSRIMRSFRSPMFERGGKDSKLLGVINVMQDITESKAAERSRDEFFSIASHELRTPLTAIRGNTSMIIDYYGDQLKDPSLKEMIGDIHDSSIRLITIVNDFLNTSRLEQGKIEFKLEPFEPADLIDEVIKEFKAGDSGAKVPIEPSLQVVPNVLADRDRLKEVLINLIGNAVKFTDAGVITVGLLPDGDNIKFRVTDSGKGIPKESQGLLFRKFQQASNNILTRDNTRSTGLGLYISKLIITGMGGEIVLEKSDAGKGATFAVTLPAAKLATPASHGKIKSAPSKVKS